MKPLVDLTIPLYEGMQVYPGHPHTEIDLVKRFGRDGREVRKISMSCHAGTHLDAPRHFIPRGSTVDEIDNELFVGPCRMINHGLGGRWEAWDWKLLAKTTDLTRVMFRSGWYKHYGTEKYYQGGPILGPCYAEGMRAAGIKMVLMDFPSPDEPGKDEAHKAFFSEGIILVEYLTNTEALGDGTDCEVFVAPLNIIGADGAPCRVLARPL